MCHLTNQRGTGRPVPYEIGGNAFMGRVFIPALYSETVYLFIKGNCAVHAWVENQVSEQASQTPDKYISLEAILPETMVSGQLSSEILTAGV